MVNAGTWVGQMMKVEQACVGLVNRTNIVVSPRRYEGNIGRALRFGSGAPPTL